MYDVYYDVPSVKSALTDLTPVLPIINGRGGGTVFTRGATERVHIGRGPFHTTFGESSIFNRNKRISDFTNWFIERAFSVGEYNPYKIEGYIGLIGPNGQILDYIHSDSVAERITSTICTADINPTTRIMPIVNHQDDESRAQLNYLGATVSEVPDCMFQNQIHEGGIAHFVINQLHGEQPLPENTAKIFLAASFRY